MKSKRVVLSLPREKENEDKSPRERKPGILIVVQISINGASRSDNGLGGFQANFSIAINQDVDKL
jgi:hypothetical protein